jgi:hypothetical protein
MLRIYKTKFVIYNIQVFFVFHDRYTRHGLEIKFLKTSLYDENTVTKSESYIFLKALKVSFFLFLFFYLVQLLFLHIHFLGLLFPPFFCHIFIFITSCSFLSSLYSSVFSFTLLVSSFLFSYYSFFLPYFISLSLL